MTLLHLFSYAAVVAAFVFVTLSLASGLLYVSELIEEHSRIAKTIGQRGIYIIIFAHILLYFFDSLPLSHIAFSILCHVIYLQNFSSSWPLISLTSVSFIASCTLVVADHFLWFFYFARITEEARHKARGTSYRPRHADNIPSFADIATFFGLCVWLAPLFLFLSLSANDNALPTSSDREPVTPTSTSHLHTTPRSSLFKSLFSVLPLDSLPRIRAKNKRRDTSEGIIAPRSPILTPSLPPLPPSPSPSMSRSMSRTLSPVPPSPTRRSTAELRGSPSFTLGSPPRRPTLGARSATEHGVLGPSLRRVSSRS